MDEGGKLGTERGSEREGESQPVSQPQRNENGEEIADHQQTQNPVRISPQLEP
jgi:hypothetical protein